MTITSHVIFVDCTSGDGLHNRVSPLLFKCIDFFQLFSNSVKCVLKTHSFGPYGNLRDKLVTQFVGVLLIRVKCCLPPTLRGDGYKSEGNFGNPNLKPHQESWPSTVVETVNKNNILFNRNVGFVSSNTDLVNAPKKSPVDMNDMQAYLKVASAVLTSGVPNYKDVWVPLISIFDLKYIEANIQGYHDKALLDYLTFGFSLSIDNKQSIRNNASDNHSSANASPTEVREYIQSEITLGSLVGPFLQPPHEQFTWSPLMMRPKDTGRRVILDLSFGEFSVNKATHLTQYDHTSFNLKLPHMDEMIPQLEKLGSDARLFKVDISRAFRNIRIDPGDALHLGISLWGSPQHSHIPMFLMAKKGFVIYNYIDDMYACCHVDTANEAFEALVDITTHIGLPMNKKKVFQLTKVLTIMGIVVDVDQRTFSIPLDKLYETMFMDYVPSRCLNYTLRNVTCNPC